MLNILKEGLFILRLSTNFPLKNLVYLFWSEVPDTDTVLKALILKD